MLYGNARAGWGSPSRTAARLAHLQAIQEKAAVLRGDRIARGVPLETTQAPVTNPTSRPVAGSLSAPAPQYAEGRALWLVPLSGGIVIALGVVGAYWLRWRSLASLGAARLTVSSGPAVGLLPGAAPGAMGRLPRPRRRRVMRAARAKRPRFTQVLRFRLKTSGDAHAESLRQLQLLGVMPVQSREAGPGLGLPPWMAAALSDELQMYGGGSDPIPNYAYLENAARMIAQVEHQKAAEAIVWSNQRWQR
jgi:hypothetical protein